ncbi:MAG TPA: ANTAR domain-containing protein [Bacillota bacterium]|nr:ANTAR domain-containing protein [Bacillota bacterium]
MSLLTAVLACKDYTASKHLAGSLENLGIQVLGQGRDYWQSIKFILDLQPEVVVLHHSLTRNIIMEIIQFVDEHRLAQVIAVTDPMDEMQLRTLLDAWIFNYLPEPVNDQLLAAAISSGRACFKRLLAMEKDNRELRQNLEKKKLLDKAKALLITNKGLSEQQAFRYLQKESMNKCVPVTKIAEQVIRLLEKNNR